MKDSTPYQTRLAAISALTARYATAASYGCVTLDGPAVSRGAPHGITATHEDE